jgi:hypothetical protein
VVGSFIYSSSGSTTLTASNSISIGSFNQSLGILVDNGNTITVTGTGVSTWSKTGGTFTATGTVKFTGAAPEIGAFSFNNLQINVGAANSATLTGSVTVSGTLILTDGTLSNGSNLTLGNGATTARHRHSGRGAHLGSAVNVTYTGDTGVTTGNELPSSTSVLNNLTLVLSSASLTLNVAQTVNGTVTAGVNSALADGGLTLTAKGNVSNSGTHGGAGRILLTGVRGSRLLGVRMVICNWTIPTAPPERQPYHQWHTHPTVGKITTGGNTSSPLLMHQLG